MARLDLGKVVGDSASVNVGTTTTLNAGQNASVENVGTTQNAIFNFGIPRGADGTNGTDGFSPTASVSQSGNITTITITDKNGTTTASIDLGAVGGDVLKEMNNYNNSNSPFIFANKEVGLYLVGERTTSGSNFYFKKDSNSGNNSIAGYPMFMEYYKDINEIGTPSANTYFANLYIVDNGGSEKGYVYSYRFYLDTSGNIHYDSTILNFQTITNGTQTFYGIKTFNNLPECSSAPTSNNQFANKKYVDDSITTAIGNINTILATLTTPDMPISLD